MRIDFTIPPQHSEHYFRMMFPFLDWNIRMWCRFSWCPDFHGYASVLWIGPLWIEWGRSVRAG